MALALKFRIAKVKNDQFNARKPLKMWPELVRQDAKLLEWALRAERRHPIGGGGGALPNFGLRLSMQHTWVNVKIIAFKGARRPLELVHTSESRDV